MSKIKSKHTKPEMTVRKYLHGQGFRYRLHVKTIVGNPDIVLAKYRTVIFVNGCFWHGHTNCRYFVLPKSRTEWWADKINKNVLREERNIIALEKAGWTVLQIWECELKRAKVQTLINLEKAILRSPES